MLTRTQVICAFRLHKRTWLADFGWMCLPWSRQKKNSFQQFIDLVAEATGLLEFADALESTRTSELDRCSPTEAAERVMSRLFDLVQRMKQRQSRSNVLVLHGPPVFTLNTQGLTEASLERIRLRGYPKKSSGSADSVFDSLQTSRLMHIYWTVLLEIYMVILGSPILRPELNSCSDVAEPPETASNDRGYHRRSEASIREECRRLADDISLYGEFCSQSIWQSFGPMSTYPEPLFVALSFH